MTIDRRTLLLGASGLATLGIDHVAESNSSDSPLKKERVQGIGGLFFRSHDPKGLAAWYQEHLGIDPTPVDYNAPVWQQQAWMVNFRVRNLDAMVKQLRASNIEVKVDEDKYPNGRFARLHDPEGNPIECASPCSNTRKRMFCR